MGQPAGSRVLAFAAVACGAALVVDAWPRMLPAPPREAAVARVQSAPPPAPRTPAATLAVEPPRWLPAPVPLSGALSAPVVIDLPDLPGDVDLGAGLELIERPDGSPETRGPEWVVVDETGAPVRGVEFGYQGYGGAYSLFSDAAGRFGEPPLLWPRERPHQFDLRKAPEPFVLAPGSRLEFGRPDADRRVRLVRGGWIAFTARWRWRDRSPLLIARPAGDLLQVSLRRLDGPKRPWPLEARRDQALRDGPFPPGAYELSAARPGIGYVPPIRIEIAPDRTTDLGDLPVLPGGTLRVRVEAADGARPGAVTMAVRDTLADERTAWSDQEYLLGGGLRFYEWNFVGLPPTGRYRLRVWREGDTGVTIDGIEVRNDETTERTAVLPARPR